MRNFPPAYLLLIAAHLLGGVRMQVVGTATSGGQFRLSDLLVGSAGVISWDLIQGDHLAAQSSPVLVKTKGGAFCLLDPGAEVVLDVNRIQMINGSILIGCDTECGFKISAEPRSVILKPGLAYSVTKVGQNVKIETTTTVPRLSAGSWVLRNFPYHTGMELPGDTGPP